MPALEMLLVDCFADKILFTGKQDFMDDIFQKAFAKSSVVSRFERIRTDYETKLTRVLREK